MPSNLRQPHCHVSLPSQILGNVSEFQRVVEVLQDNLDFDIDVNASVFETNIRGKGCLLWPLEKTEWSFCLCINQEVVKWILKADPAKVFSPNQWLSALLPSWRVGREGLRIPHWFQT